MSSAATLAAPGLSQVDESAYPSGRYPWYVVGVLLVVWTLSHIDRHAINILILPIKNDIGLSETQMGLLLGPAFILFYAAAGLPMGKLADHRSRRNLLMGGLIVWSLGTAAAGFARSFEALFAARAVVGLGEACLVPAAFSLIADYFPPSSRGKAIAGVTVGVAVGGSLSLVGGGVVLELMQGLENRPLPIIGVKTAWELVFITFGLAGVVVALLMATVREPARLTQHKQDGGPRSSFIAFLRRKRLAMFLILTPYILVTFALHAFAAWAPTLLVRHHGMSLGDAAQLKGWVMLFVTTAAAIAGGVIGDYFTSRWKGGRFLLVAFLTPVLLPGLALSCLAPNLWLVALGIALAQASGGMLGMGVYAAIQDVVPADMRGRSLALFTVLAQLIALGAGPTVVALVTEHVLGDPALLHWSILIACFPAWIGALLCGLFGLRHFRAMRDEAAADNPETITT